MFSANVAELDPPLHGGMHQLHPLYDASNYFKSPWPTPPLFPFKDQALAFWRNDAYCHGTIFVQEVQSSNNGANTTKNHTKKFLVICDIDGVKIDKEQMNGADKDQNDAMLIIPPLLLRPLPAEQAPSFYEIVLRQLPCRMYMDVDVHAKNLNGAMNHVNCLPLLYNRSTLEARVIDYAQQQLHRAHGLANANVKLVRVVTYESNKYSVVDGSIEKISLHMTLIVGVLTSSQEQYVEYVWKSNEHVKRLLNLESLASDELFGKRGTSTLFVGDECIIDDKVYDMDRNMRVYGATKWGQARPFKEARLYKLDVNSTKVDGDYVYETMNDDTQKQRLEILKHGLIMQTTSRVGGVIELCARNGAASLKSSVSSALTRTLSTTDDTPIKKRKLQQFQVGTEFVDKGAPKVDMTQYAELSAFIDERIKATIGFKSFRSRRFAKKANNYLTVYYDRMRPSEERNIPCPAHSNNAVKETHSCENFYIDVWPNRMVWFRCWQSNAKRRLGLLLDEVRVPK